MIAVLTLVAVGVVGRGVALGRRVQKSHGTVLRAPLGHLVHGPLLAAEDPPVALRLRRGGRPRALGPRGHLEAWT